MTRPFVDQIIMPIVFGALILLLAALAIWTSTGAKPAMVEIADWPTTAQVISTLWMTMVAFVVGFGPWWATRKVLRAIKAES